MNFSSGLTILFVNAFICRFLEGIAMGKLADIESAVSELTVDEQARLLQFIAERMGNAVSFIQMPPPRDIPIKQIREWIAEDEEGMRRFREGA